MTDLAVLFSNNIIIAAFVVYAMLLYFAFMAYYNKDKHAAFIEFYVICTSCLIIFFIFLVVFYLVFVVWSAE
jgi:hypothetical protein